MKRILLLWAIVPATALPCLAQTIGPAAVESARDTLTQVVQPTPAGEAVLRGLAMTGDPAIAPLLEAMSASDDRRRQMLAVSTLGQLLGEEAAPVLHSLMQSSRDPSILTVTLDQLLRTGQITVADVRAALAVSDPALSLLAARGAAVLAASAATTDTAVASVQEQARTELERLLDGASAQVEPIARMLLLAMDDLTQLEPLGELLLAPAAPTRGKMLLLNMIERQAIVQALPLVDSVLAQPNAELRVRTQALTAALAVAPQRYASTVQAELAACDSPVAAVMLLRAMRDHGFTEDAGPAPLPWPGPLAYAEHSFVAAGAELVRPPGQPLDEAVVAQAALALAALRDPVVVGFVISQAEAQTELRPAYVPALLQVIRQAPPTSRGMGPEHETAIAAATLLLEIGGYEAIEPLREILTGPYNAVSRAVASSLAISDAPAAAELAAELLDNPYDELAVSAALALGRAGDPRAAGRLTEILDNPRRYPAGAPAIAAWYLLKLAGQAETTIQSLADQTP